MRDQTRQALQTALQTAWATSPPTELVFSDAVRTAETKVAWARATVHFPDAYNPATIGDMTRRGLAIVMLQVFTPEKEGGKAAYLAADRLDTLALRRIAITGVSGWTCHAESDGLSEGPTPAGPRNGYQQHNIRLTFRIEAYRA